MERKDVFGLIDGERAYQDSKSRQKSDADTSVAEWVIYINHYLNAAIEHAYHLDEKSTLEDIRKIAALAVACMEYNETPERK